MEPQLKTLKEEVVPCSESGLQKRVLPVLALNEVI